MIEFFFYIIYFLKRIRFMSPDTASLWWGFPKTGIIVYVSDAVRRYGRTIRRVVVSICFDKINSSIRDKGVIYPKPDRH
jgi:hypothetical protein